MQHSMEHDMFQYAADRCRFTTSRVGLLSPFGYSRRWPLGKAGAADSLRWTSCAPRLHIGVRNWFFPELPEGARAWHYLDFYVLELGLRTTWTSSWTSTTWSPSPWTSTTSSTTPWTSSTWSFAGGDYVFGCELYRL